MVEALVTVHIRRKDYFKGDVSFDQMAATVAEIMDDSLHEHESWLQFST
jgi:hypothetical protein